jgi:hypothetical protein
LRLAKYPLKSATSNKFKPPSIIPKDIKNLLEIMPTRRRDRIKK